jgi:hypothetical protein
MMFPFLFDESKTKDSPATARRVARMMLFYLALVSTIFGFFYFLVY